MEVTVRDHEQLQNGGEREGGEEREEEERRERRAEQVSSLAPTSTQGSS